MLSQLITSCDYKVDIFSLCPGKKSDEVEKKKKKKGKENEGLVALFAFYFSATIEHLLDAYSVLSNMVKPLYMSTNPLD